MALPKGVIAPFSANRFSSLVNDASGPLRELELDLTNNQGYFQNRLDTAIKNLEVREKHLYSLFGVSSLEELQKKLDKLRETSLVFKSLSGPSLWSIINPALKAGQAQDFRYNAVLESIVKKQLQEEFGNNEEVIKNLATEEFAGVVIRAFNNIHSSSVKFTSTKGITSKNVARIEDLAYTMLSPHQKRFIEGIVNKSYKDKKLKKEFEALNINKITIDVNNWFTITEGLKASETENFSEEKINEIREGLIEYLKSIFNDSELESIIREVFQQKKSFLIGKNIIDGITGILGEIQGLYFVRKSLVPNNLSVKEAKWVGGIAGETKKDPHEDIKLISTITHGIQVKNTTKNLEKEWEYRVDFLTRSIDSFFDALTNSTALISPSEITALQQVFFMESFNVPYVFHEKKYLETDLSTLSANNKNNPALNNYIDAKNTLKSLVEIAEKIVAAFSDVAMYMGSDTTLASLADTSGNDIYLIGGTKLFAASEILKVIKQQISSNLGKKYFTTSTSLRKGDSKQNIVTFLNGEPFKGDQLTLTLTSSYVFTG